jgi:hypothetical protein
LCVCVFVCLCVCVFVLQMICSRSYHFLFSFSCYSLALLSLFPNPRFLFFSFTVLLSFVHALLTILQALQLINFQFDAQIILDGVFLGSADAANNRQGLEENKISHILSVYDGSPHFTEVSKMVSYFFHALTPLL